MPSAPWCREANLLSRSARRFSKFVVAAAAVCVLAPALTARADEFVDRVNNAIRKVGPDKRSETVLLPLLPAMEAPPAVLQTQHRAALFGNKGPDWQEAAAWAQRDPQKAVLQALATVTRDENDPQRGFAFTLPYGVDATDPSLVRTEMYIDLGDPPTLSAAKYLYLDELENVGILAHVEASRLVETGDPSAALTVMKNWMFFSRQMADRPMLKEKLFGMESLALALERLADIGYTDFRADQHDFQPSQLVSMVGLLRDRSLYVDRIRLPEGEFIAREQLISRVIIQQGGPNPQTFAPTMARIGAVDRPLKLFSSAAFWEQAREGHAGWFDLQERLKNMRTDWERRWQLSPFDIFQQRISYFRLNIANRPRFAVIGMGMDKIEDLFGLRRKIDTLQAGTRMGLAAYAYSLREKQLPQLLSAVRPAFARTIDTDPYSSTKKDLEYFIPVLQTPRDEHGRERPFSIRLWLEPPLPTFEVPLDKTHFIIYSVGPDDRPQQARDCTQGRTGEGDYLLWPPPLSLLRQYLLDQGNLK